MLAALQPRWQRWLARRIPPARQITLQGRCLFILPTRLGLWYLLVMLAIYLLGTNYQQQRTFDVLETAAGNEGSASHCSRLFDVG